MKRKVIWQLAVPLLGLCVLFLLMTADPAKPRRETDLLAVSVLLRESDGSAWTTARQGMEQAAADLGAELRVLTPRETGSVEEQRELLAREVEAGAAAVLLVPADRTALAEDVAQAAGRAAVVTMETDMTRSGAAAYVGVDNADLGAALGKAALSGVPVGGRVLLLDSAPGDTGVRERLDAAAGLLEAAGREVRVCAPGEGQTLAQALERRLSAVRPDMVLAFEAAALETAAKSIQAREDPPLLYGMGATGAVAAALEQGGITAIAAQNEFSAGYLAVQAAVEAAGRRPRTVLEPLEFAMVRRETMYDPDHQKLLFPVTR